MTYDPVTTSTLYGNPDDQQPRNGVRDQAWRVGSEAARAGAGVTHTTREQGREVVQEATRQARDLYGEARSQLASQSGEQQRRAASGLHSLAEEMRSMAQHGGQSGPVTELAHHAADRMHGVASWLEERQPGDVVSEVREYAGRNPGTFLVGAALLGIVAGRLTRNMATADSAGQHPDAQHTGLPYDGMSPPVADPDRTAVLPPSAERQPAADGFPDPLAGGHTTPPYPHGYAAPMPPTGGQPLPPASRTDPLPGVPSSGATRRWA